MPEPKPVLIGKLAEITGLMAKIPKDGWNANQKYKFVKESDVAEKVSALLAERKIFLHQTVTSHQMTALYVTQSSAQMWLTEVVMQFRFIDGETGEVTEPATFVGHGADTGDKGVYKAMTGAEKYFLMKTFLISTGDDPEADEKVDKAADAAGAAKGPVRVGKSAVPGAGRGGKSSLVTSAQVSEIVKLVTKLKLDASSFSNIIHKVSGLATEGKTGKELLESLTSDQAAGIVTALMAMDTFDAEIGDGDDADDHVPDEDAGDTPVV
jgi:hypothetical protein